MSKTIIIVLVIIIIIVAGVYYFNNSNSMSTSYATDKLIASMDDGTTGTVTFGKGGAALGSVSGPKADQLKKDWVTVSARPSLNWSRTTQTGYETVEVGPKNAAYPYAAAYVLQHEFGYSVDIAPYSM